MRNDNGLSYSYAIQKVTSINVMQTTVLHLAKERSVISLNLWNKT